jgi:hypothetical protein
VEAPNHDDPKPKGDLVSTHFTRRGGARPPSDEDTREGRFARDDTPRSPLVEEQQERHPLDRAPLRDRAAAPAPSPGGWRATVAGTSLLSLLAGIWLIIAPFVLGYGDGDPIWNDVVFGAIVGVIALVQLAGAYRAAWLSWIGAVIGAWIFAAAFWLDDTSTAQTNDIVLGAIVFVLAIAAATAGGEGAAAERRGLRA